MTHNIIEVDDNLVSFAMIYTKKGKPQSVVSLDHVTHTRMFDMHEDSLVIKIVGNYIKLQRPA